MLDNLNTKLAILFSILLLVLGCATETTPAPTAPGSSDAVVTTPAIPATPMLPPHLHAAAHLHTIAYVQAAAHPHAVPYGYPDTGPDQHSGANCHAAGQRIPRVPTPTPNPYGKWQQNEWQNRSDETHYEVFVRGNGAYSVRLRLDCGP